MAGTASLCYPPGVPPTPPDPSPPEEKASRHASESSPADAAAAERQRLAQQLHDTVSQSLTAVYLTAKAAEARLRQRGSDGTREVFDLGELIHGTLTELHEIMRGLAPP